MRIGSAGAKVNTIVHRARPQILQLTYKQLWGSKTLAFIGTDSLKCPMPVARMHTHTHTCIQIQALVLRNAHTRSMPSGYYKRVRQNHFLPQKSTVIYQVESANAGKHAKWTGSNFTEEDQPPPLPSPSPSPYEKHYSTSYIFHVARKSHWAYDLDFSD